MKITMPLIFVLALLSSVHAKEIPYTQEDRDRLIRVEAKIEAIDKRFEDINKRFEDISKRFEDMQKQTDRLSAIFTALVVAVIGFAVWDRRTMVRPFEAKVKKIEDDIAENRSKLHSLIEAFKDLSKTDEKAAEILRKFNIL